MIRSAEAAIANTEACYPDLPKAADCRPEKLQPKVGVRMSAMSTYRVSSFVRYRT